MEFVTRFALFCCTLLVLGALSFGIFVVPRAVKDVGRRLVLQRRAARAGLMASLLLLPIIAGRLYFQLSAMRFPGEPLFQSFKPLMAETMWGMAWLLQVAGAMAAVAFFRLAGTRRMSQVGWWLCPAFALLIVITLPLSGHAAGAQAGRVIAIAADAMHVLGAGTWLGTLSFVLLLVLRAAPSSSTGASASEKYDVVRTFSPLALACVAVIAVSGAVSGLFHIKSFADLTGSEYGRMLLIKLGLVGVALAFGYVNWKRNTPKMPHDGGAAMTRGVWRELSAAVLVLLMTSALVVTPPPLTQ